MQLSEFLVEDIDTIQFAAFFLLFGLLMLLERIAPARTIRGRWARLRANLGLTAAAMATFALLPASLLGAALWAEEHRQGLIHAAQLPLPAAVLATLLARSFLSYATHLAMHKVPWLWSIHRVHHLDTALDVSSTVRFHPLELLVGALFGVPFVVALGLLPLPLAVYELLDVVVTLFSHANVRLPSGVDRWLAYGVVTPGLHVIHHSSWQPETDSNFGAVFPIWDQVLGTYRARPVGHVETMALGLQEVRDARVDELGWLLASPFRRLGSSGIAEAVHGR